MASVLEDRDPDLRRAEAWLRRRGLPLVVRRRVRGVALLQRATPAVVFLLLFDPLLSVLAALVDVTAAAFDRNLESTGYVITVLALTVAALVVPPLGGWLVARLMRRMSERGRLIVAAVVLVLAVVVLPAIERWTDLRAGLIGTALVNLAAVVVVVLLTYAGVGSILGWAVRAAVRQVGAVGAMASRALPLLLLVVLFSFFSAEVWQLTDAQLGMDRRRLWFVVLFFGILGTLFLSAVVSDEMSDLDHVRRAEGPEQLRARLAGTPLAALVPDDHIGGRHRLSRSERANVVLVFFFAQAIQALFFGWLVFVFFVVFGALAITDDVIQAWVGHPTTDGTLFRQPLPVSNQLVQVAVFLGAFSGLYFAGSTAIDPHYRKRFFDPLAADVQVSLAAREAYLARFESRETDSPTQ